jgi:hypothetical protein
MSDDLGPWPEKMYLLHPSLKSFGDRVTYPERREYVRADLVDPAAIREAAWIEALDAAHEYTSTQYGMGFLKHPVDRERIIALNGEKK